MFHAPMKNLAKTAEEIKEEMPSVARVMMASDKPAAPVYPYGCCISLDEATMEKLGLAGEMPEVGDIIHFCCEAKVTAIPGEREGADGKVVKSGCVELQITDMGSPTSPEMARGEKWYGAGSDSAGDDEA